MGHFRGLWRAAMFALVLGAALAVSALPQHAQAASAQYIPHVPLQAGEDAPPLAPFIRFMEPGTLADLPLVSQPPPERLREVASDDIQFGQAGSEVLAFVRLRNISDQAGSWIFTTGRGSLTEFSLYSIEPGNPPRLVMDGADRQQVRENLFEYQAFSHNFSLEPGQELVLAFHMRTEGSTWMPLAVQTFPSFFAARRENIALVSGVVSGALILILFNVIFFAITGKREFAWLGAAQVVFTINTIHAEGYTTIFLLHDRPLLAQWLGEIMRALYAVLMIQFGRVFLDTRRNFPRVDWLMKAAIAVGIAFIVAAEVAVAIGQDGWTGLRLACWAYLGVVSFALPWVAIAAYRKLGRQYWPLVLSWTSLAGFIVYAAIAMSGLVSNLPITWHLIGPVGLFECALATLALGLHLRVLQTERLQAGVELQESLRRQIETSRAAARLAEERASAMAAVRDQDRLLHASGHDSRQVLLALNAVADYAETDAGQGIPGHVVGMIRSSASYLRDIVDTTRSAPILAYDGSNLVALGQFHADQPLRQLEKIHAPLLLKKGVTCRVTCEDGLRLVSDRSLLTRALSNLVSNAVRFTDAGEVEISAIPLVDRIAFSVRDTGRGMDQELLDRIMADRNWHMPSGDGQGSGTGLSSVRRITGALRGELAIRSEPGLGTEVTLSIPLFLPRDTAAPMDLDGLRAELPDIELIDLDAGPGAPLVRQSGGTGRGAVGIASDTTAQTRDLAHSANLHLILTRPLTGAMLRHPILAAIRAAPDPAQS